MAQALADLHADRTVPKPPKSSFFLPMWFMPPARRHALHTLYDFCRCVDDAVDEAVSTKEALEGLHHWQQELRDVYHGAPFHPAARGLQQTVRRYGIPETVLQEMMKGFETDAADSLALRNDAELELYCSRVAGCVGIASLPIFGVSIEAYTPFALALGHALQITNILRDIDEDLMRGRCYIPADLLARSGITPENTDAVYARQWNKACAGLAEIAEDYFIQTLTTLKPAHSKKLIPALLMRDAYHVLLLRMMRSGVYFRKPGKVKRTRADVASLLMQGVRYCF